MINYIKNKIARRKAKKYVTECPVYGPSQIKPGYFGKFPHWITHETVNDAGLRGVADIKIYVDGEEISHVKSAYPSPYPRYKNHVIVYDTDENGSPYLTDCEEFALKRLEGIVTYSVSLKA